MKNFNCEFRYTWANNDPGFLMKEMTLRHNTVFFFHNEATGCNDMALRLKRYIWFEVWKEKEGFMLLMQKLTKLLSDDQWVTIPDVIYTIHIT